MAIGNAIRLMCRASKSRIGDHFQAAIGLANELEDRVPEVPDCAYDRHTRRGTKARARAGTLSHRGCQAPPPPDTSDPYEDEAYRLFALKAKRAVRGKIRCS